MKLLDLFCGAGGAAMGYHRAGFDQIVGVDIEPQPKYPFEFVQADALEYLLAQGQEFDLVHASPPCQAYSRLKGLASSDHPELIEPTREILVGSGKPYVIENVPGAPLVNPITLCGSMFGLQLIRHRLFECKPAIWFVTMSCACKGLFTNADNEVSSFENGATAISVVGHNFKLDDAKMVMGIDWMNREELAQAIPPAYTEWIGKEMMQCL
jgi:DNA (cytosine-5)-methyltransferase 1